MPAPLQVNVYYDKSVESRAALAAQFEKHVRTTLPSLTINKFRHVDAHEAYIHADVNVHLDWPVLAAVPWALVNLVVRHSGDAWCEAWEGALQSGGFDCVVEELELLDAVAFGKAICTIIKFVEERRPKGVVHCPPLLHIEDCPAISIITPTFNRKKLLDIAFHNLMSTDYPADKIEWIVVEDAEKSEDMASDVIINFQMNYKKINVKYIPIQGRMTIGEKRNHGIEHSTNDIILFMDDDDHYPPTSFRRRVAWLLKGRRGDRIGCDVAACTTIALYDLMRGVSAVNVPPWRLPLSQRISEATLTFRKSFWEERKFSHVSMAEGEEWLKGREDRCMEIAPQQIIVAFTHSGNASSRRVAPPDAQVSCFWGFPKEYLMFIHKLAGVEIVEDKKGGGGASGASGSKRGGSKKV